MRDSRAEDLYSLIKLPSQDELDAKPHHKATTLMLQSHISMVTQDCLRAGSQCTCMVHPREGEKKMIAWLHVSFTVRGWHLPTLCGCSQKVYQTVLSTTRWHSYLAMECDPFVFMQFYGFPVNFVISEQTIFHYQMALATSSGKYSLYHPSCFSHHVVLPSQYITTSKAVSKKVEN